MKRDNSKASRRYKHVLFMGLGTLVAMTGLALILTILALEMQSGAQAYVTGSHHWTRGISASSYALDRFISSGAPSDYRAARKALAIPLADMRARQAMDEEAPAPERAREGLLRGSNAPEDISSMIFLYENFRWLPYFREAVSDWRRSDEALLRLQNLLQEARTTVLKGNASEPERQRLLQRLSALHDRATALANHFVVSITNGVRLLKKVLVGGAIFLALLYCTTLAYVGYRMMEWLRSRDRRFQAAFDQAAVGMAQLDLNGMIQDANEALCRTLGRSREELIDQSYTVFTHPDDIQRSVEQRRAIKQGRLDSYTSEKRFIRGDGCLIWVKQTSSMTYDDDGHPEQIISIVEDITEAHELADRLTYQARHDDLTGLFNRREMERRLNHAIDKSKRDGISHVLCFIDLDQFKVVNDTCGHLAGDQLLKSLSEVLDGQVRETDVVGRLGGDEFAVILHETDLDGAFEAADKIRRALTEFVFGWADKSFRVSATIGLAEISPQTGDVIAVLRAADTACHLAKDMGRNQVHAYQAGNKAVEEYNVSLEWLSTLRGALEAHRLRLYAQRIDTTHEGDKPRIEALVRLEDEQGRIHTPGAFLPSAERYNLIGQIDQEVFNLALRHLSENRDKLDGLDCCHINASGVSLGSPDYLQFVLDSLIRWDIPGHKLCFEVTETAAIANLKEAQNFFRQVRQHGCQVALDDFGSGLSSFGYLKNLPVDLIKIDGTFVRYIADNAQDQAVVKAIHDVGKALGKLTVAECVEDMESVAFLRQVGVDYVQGFALHRPEPLEKVLQHSRTTQARNIG
ncbi:EAL domain-containing protein [Marinobacteraceae bacterium S3BR75-40.1]